MAIASGTLREGVASVSVGLLENRPRNCLREEPGGFPVRASVGCDGLIHWRVVSTSFSIVDS